MTAFSIMFLAVQFRSATWRGRRLLAVAAVAALIELFVPLLVALIALMDGHPWRIAAALAGGLGLLVVGVHWLVYWRFPEGMGERKVRDSEEPAIVESVTKFNRLQLYGSAISTLVYGAVTASAFNPGRWGLHLLAIACVWLLFSGSFEAWWLLEPKFAGSAAKS